VEYINLAPAQLALLPAACQADPQMTAQLLVARHTQARGGVTAIENVRSKGALYPTAVP